VNTFVMMTLLIAAGSCTGCGDVTSTLIAPSGVADLADAREPDSASNTSNQGHDNQDDAEDSTLPLPDAGAPSCIEHQDCASNGDDVICHPTWKRCVECTQDGHCHDVGEACSSVLGECAIPCQDAKDCDDDDPICDQTLGFCVDCQVDEDCPASQLCRRSNCVGLDGRDD